MTIASAFNEIAVAQGGTASKSGSIAGAIDALNDALAGSDQQAAQTIEDAVRLLGANIGSGGGGGGGDFTTATVTLQNAEGTTTALNLYCASVASASEGLPEASFVSQYSQNASHEFTALLYKGKCLAYPERDTLTITTEGDVTYDSDLELYIITGDCTFTFSNE